jgi:uncharacterized protein (TIGR03437 family)
MRSLPAVLLSSFLSCVAMGQSFTISTFAGGGQPINIPGTSASLSTPSEVAVDAAGNAFFTSGNTVLRLDGITGILSLVAGNGTYGFSGDNGAAANAQLAAPTGVAVDLAGNLYVADGNNLRVRKVSNGIITTVAGNGTGGYSGDNGPAVSAQLSYPSGVAVDTSGNLYIADNYNNCIRKVSNGLITTVAGTGIGGFSGDGGLATSAHLTGPTGVAVDAAGNLYIVDTGNARIRLVSKGVINTVAGGGTSFGDNGPATSALLSFPYGLAVDHAGNLYISDPGSERVRKVVNGVIFTVAGNGTTGFSGDYGTAVTAELSDPQGVAVDSAGNLYITDSLNYRLRKVSNGVITTAAGGGSSIGDNGLATSAQLNLPNAVSLDAAGNVYIADNANSRIRKVSSGVITTVAGDGVPSYSGDNGPATSAGLGSPSGVAVDFAGNVYMADRTGNRVRKVTNGVITTFAGGGSSLGDNGPATSAQLNGPTSIAVDSSGNVYISDTSNSRIRRVTNGMIITVAGTGAYGFSGDTGPATNAQLNYPQGIAVDAAGDLFIADSLNDRIRKVSGGVITTVAGTVTVGFSGDGGPAVVAQLSVPEGIAVDAAGNLYIADTLNERIRKVSNGFITTIAGGGVGGFSGDGGLSTSAQLNLPEGVAVDSAGNIYIADVQNNRIRVLTAVAGSSCTYSVTPASLQAPAAGGNVIVGIQTGAACSWTVSALPSWITVAGGTSGMGPGSVTLVVAPDTGIARNTNVLIAGAFIVVSQTGASQLGLPYLTGINNAGSNLSTPIAPGEIITITGSGLGPAQIISASLGSDGLYDAALAGTSIQFNGIPAPMIYTSATQVAAIVPYAVAVGTAQVTVTYQGQISAPVTVAVAASAPGLFTQGSTGQGQAAAINQNGSLNTSSNPVPLGSIISLYATGEGQTTPGGVDGKLATAPYPTPNLPVNVTIGGIIVNNLQYVGGAPGNVAGLLQINVAVPAGVTPGSAVPVVIRVGNVTSQTGVTIAVSAN